MLKNNYLSVMMFQLKLTIVCDSQKDSLVLTEEYFTQMKNSIEAIQKFLPDICVFPEMSYQEEYAKELAELSKSERLIVFGSDYVGNINKTKVFFDGKLYEITKRYPCGSEPMIRFYEKPDVNTFINDFLSEHEFYIKGHKVYVLNCLEYYQSAYMIARDSKLSENLFGFIVPCSNSNPKVFMEESKALHNHNENVYSFVCNRIKNNGENGYGKSYIFGPIQYHEKDWLKEDGIFSEEHNSSILTLDASTPAYTFGKYLTPDSVSRFGRSDYYFNTPTELIVKNLL